MATQIPDHVFRGYDLRGLVGSELDDENVLLLARGYATWLLKRRIFDCVVGYDCRISSPKFHDIMVRGLTESGITVYDIGLTLSQISYFAQYYFRTRGLVMVTASHNPKEYNGFKFGTGFSETMLTGEIIELRDIVKKNEFKTVSPQGKHIQQDIKQIYIDDLFRHVPPIKKFKVVVDSCAATTGIFLPEILRRAGCEVIEQNTTPDGNFPVGTPDPTERDVQERLARRVVAEGADLGFSYDCDGDRIGIVEEDGTLLWNDTLVSLFAKDVLEFLPGSRIVYNVLCSKQVTDVIKQFGGVPVMWMTGHSFIKAKAKEEHAAFAGELSGHFFILDNFYGHDDGAMASLRILAYLSRTNQSLKQAVAGLPQYISSPEIKMGCADYVKFDVVSKKIATEIKKLYPDASYVEIDGIRMEKEDGMLIVRASQNGPYITIKFEGKTQETYDLLKKQAAEILNKYPEIDISRGTNTHALE